MLELLEKVGMSSIEHIFLCKMCKKWGIKFEKLLGVEGLKTIGQGSSLMAKNQGS